MTTSRSMTGRKIRFQLQVESGADDFKEDGQGQWRKIVNFVATLVPVRSSGEIPVAQKMKEVDEYFVDVRTSLVPCWSTSYRVVRFPRGSIYQINSAIPVTNNELWTRLGLKRLDAVCTCQ